jgi:anti-anti-sigma regulatory factor
MDFLNSRHSAAMLRVTQLDRGGNTLLDQVLPYLKLTPHLILDLEGVLLSSMHIGELVNVVQAYQEHWGGQFQGLSLVRASDQVRRVLASTRLEAVLRPFPTADAALEAIEASR